MKRITNKSWFRRYLNMCKGNYLILAEMLLASPEITPEWFEKLIDLEYIVEDDDQLIYMPGRWIGLEADPVNELITSFSDRLYLDQEAIADGADPFPFIEEIHGPIERWMGRGCEEMMYLVPENTLLDDTEPTRLIYGTTPLANRRIAFYRKILNQGILVGS